MGEIKRETASSKSDRARETLEQTVFSKKSP